MKRSPAAVVIAGLLAACAVSGDPPDSGPAIRAVRIGEPLQGTLTSSAPRLRGGPFDVYRLSADSGMRYDVSVTSTEFDPYVMVARVVSGFSEVLVEDDNSGDSTNALARFVSRRRDDYLVVVQASDTTQLGTYTVTVAGVVPRARSAPRRITLGETVRDTLADTAVFTFAADAGERVRIDAEAQSFDTYLELGRALPGGGYEREATDDDGGTGTNSQIIYTVPSSGEYVVRVRAFADRPGGPFTVSVRRASGASARGPVSTGATPAARGALPVGREVSARLDAERAEWALSVQRGARYEVTARSDSFDTYLVVGRLVGGRMTDSLTNDDSPGMGSDSRIFLSAADTGEYLVRVRPFSSGTGPYTLTATSRAPVRATPLTRRIRIGARVTGALVDGDARAPDGSAYQDWIFSARKNERLEMTLASEAFDAYLEVGVMSTTADGRSQFLAVTSNDDGGASACERRSDQRYAESCNARVVMLVPDTGEYVIRVNTFGPEQLGPYTLELRRSR